MDSKADYRTLIDEVRRTDIPGSPEFFSRFALVTAGCAVGWLWLGLEIIPYWFAAYYGAVFLEKFLLHQYPAATSAAFMAILVGVSFLISATYVALPIYLWFLPEKIWQFGTLIMLVAGCLNICQLRARVRPMALAYFLPIGAGFAVIATDFWVGPDGGTVFAAAFAMALLLAAYLALSVFEAHKANTRVLRTRVHLIQSQKVEALESLTAGMSHDFRNIMSIIQGNLELLREQPGAADRRACIRDALAAARSGAELSAQLSLYSRQFSSAPALVDPIKVVDEVRGMARHVLPPRISIQIQTPSSMDRLHLDESALQAVLLNLIVHARDAMDGAGSITLETYVTKGARKFRSSGICARVVFEICASTPERSADLPDPFDDPDFGELPSGKGNGFALATARGFAEGAGGRFHVESMRGRGTCFRLELPA